MKHAQIVKVIKGVVLTCLLYVSFAASVHAQDELPPDDYIATIYAEAVAVVHVQVTNIVLARKDGIYSTYTVKCEVLESLKGLLRKGRKLQYSVRVESGLERPERNERLVFLDKHYRDKRKRVWNWTPVEAGEFAFTKELAAKIEQARAAHNSHQTNPHK